MHDRNNLDMQIRISRRRADTISACSHPVKRRVRFAVRCRRRARFAVVHGARFAVRCRRGTRYNLDHLCIFFQILVHGVPCT